jgi:glycosyltransferase involved in cell wall biosynthesis
VPDISVVIPTHNRSRLLHETLRTVQWQRGDVDFEVIVVDDGSTDDTIAMLESLGDERIRWLRHEQARGPGAARNTGIEAARGTWIALLDSDDWWAPDKLSLQLQAVRDTGRDWAFGGCVSVDDDGRSLTVVATGSRPTPELVTRVIASDNVIPGPASNLLFRKAVLDPGELAFDPAVPHCPDWDLCIRLTRKGPPAIVNAPLVALRNHPGNVSLDTDSALEGLRVVASRYDDMRAEAPWSWVPWHRYLGWLCLRGGLRRRAVYHYTRAAVGGEVTSLARAGVALLHPGVGKRSFYRSTPDPEWKRQVESWLSEMTPAPTG